MVQEHWRWHLYPGLGWWPVGGVKRVASHCVLLPATADRLAHDTQSSHGREAGILTCKPGKENQNKMRTLRSVFFSNTEMYDKGGKSYLSTRFFLERAARNDHLAVLMYLVTQFSWAAVGGFHAAILLKIEWSGALER